MSRKLLYLRFVGTNYHGWQVQNNALTVQEVLQNALESLYTVRPDVCGCSRTDTGVHANMYCCHFDAPSDIPNGNIIAGLNRFLPDDIAVYDCKDVPDNFHARYSVKSKTYTYRFYCAKSRNPFSFPFTYNYARKIDIEKANIFCKNICGTHDFEAFSASGRTTDDTVRTVYSACCKENGDVVEFSVTANGFLYNMVRILAGTLISVNEGKTDPNNLENIFLSHDRTLAGITVPPCGLTLEYVDYKG